MVLKWGTFLQNSFVSACIVCPIFLPSFGLLQFFSDPTTKAGKVLSVSGTCWLLGPTNPPFMFFPDHSLAIVIKRRIIDPPTLTLTTHWPRPLAMNAQPEPELWGQAPHRSSWSDFTQVTSTQTKCPLSARRASARRLASSSCIHAKPRKALRGGI